MIKVKLVLATVFALVCSSAIAGSCVPDGLDLSIRDVTRLSQLKDTRTRGMASAMLGENSSERELVSTLFSMGLGVPKTVISGNYKCRTIKMGGISALVTYGFFDCRISTNENEFRIEKLTGSQRFTGRLVVQDAGVSYQGASHYGYEEPRDYVGNSDRDQVGCFYESLGKPGSLLLELPAPFFESVHDVIELVRR